VSRSDSPDDHRRAGSKPDIACPRCGCHFALDSVTVRVAGSDRAHEVDLSTADGTVTVDGIVNEAARALVVDALRRAGGNRPAAAEIAGLEYETFYELLRVLDVRAADEPEDEAD